MKITVLMAAYEGEKYIEQQLDSILAQTVPACTPLSPFPSASLPMASVQDTSHKLFGNDSGFPQSMAAHLPYNE